MGRWMGSQERREAGQRRADRADADVYGAQDGTVGKGHGSTV